MTVLWAIMGGWLAIGAAAWLYALVHDLRHGKLRNTPISRTLWVSAVLIIAGPGGAALVYSVWWVRRDQQRWRAP